MNPEVAESAPAHKPHPGGPPSRHRGMFAGLLVAVFLSGGVAGGGVGMLLAQRQISDCLRHPERMPDRMMTKFRAELGLTDEQTARIDEIVRRHHENFEAIRAEVHPRFSAEFAAMSDEMNQVLSPQQQAQWTELREQMRKEFPRSRRDRKERHERSESK